MSPRFWIAVVSKEHTMRGVAGGFMQVCHGKCSPLKRMKEGDWVIFYSPSQTMHGKEKSQSFTAIGRTIDDHVYPFQMTDDFIPFRRNVRFEKCAETPIQPLIEQLEFIKDKSRWGYPFRFGFFEISENDFNLIASKMLKYETV